MRPPDAEHYGRVDLRRSAAAQDLRTFFERRAGRTHVVDEHDASVAESNALADSERSADVGGSLGLGQPDLMRSGPDAPQDGDVWQPDSSCDIGCKGVGGVERSVEATFPVGGYGDDGLDTIPPRRGLDRLRQPFAQP